MCLPSIQTIPFGVETQDHILRQSEAHRWVLGEVGREFASDKGLDLSRLSPHMLFTVAFDVSFFLFGLIRNHWTYELNIESCRFLHRKRHQISQLIYSFHNFFLFFFFHLQKLISWIKSLDFSLICLQLLLEPLVLQNYLPYDSLEVGKDLIDVAMPTIHIFYVDVCILDQQAFESVDVLKKSQRSRPFLHLHFVIKISLLFLIASMPSFAKQKQPMVLSEQMPFVFKICYSILQLRENHYKLLFYKNTEFIKDLLNFHNNFTMNKTVSLLALLLVLTTAVEIQVPAPRTSATIKTIGNVKVQTNSNSGCPIPHHDLDLVQCDYKQVCFGVECFGRLCCYGRNYIPEGVNGQMVVFVTFPGPIYQVTQLRNTRSEARMTDNDFQVHFNCPDGEICVFESDHQIETRDINMKKQ